MKRIKQSGKFPITLIVIFLCFSAVIIIAGTMFGSYVSKKIKLEAESDLSAIADLKLQQILLWQKNRLTEADLLSQSPFYVNAAEELIANPGNRSLRMQMRERLNAQLKSQYWHDMLLLDNKGKIVMTAGSKITTVGDKTRELLDKARLKEQPLMSDFYFCDICQTIHLDIIVPLFKLDHNTKPAKGFIGYTIMRLDPHVFLYPLIQSWPTPSKSSETLLVKKDGQDVLFLNELRFKKGTSLKFRIPLKQRSLPAAVAIAGSSGVFDGFDYRGVRVISNLRSIPGTDWHMVTKVDYDEVFSDLKRQEGLVFVIILVLIGLAASLTTAVFFAQRREHYKKLLIAETERQALIQHYDYLTKYANDIIFLLDEDHNIREINDRGLEVYGYAREEIIGRSASTIRSDDQKDIFQSQMDELVAKGGMLYETRHKRKDGSTFPVEISSRIIEIEGKKYLQGIVRDISERKQYELDIKERNEELESTNQELMASEEEIKAADEELRQQMEKLEESEERYRTTLDNMLEGCQIIDREFRYIYINDTAARHGRKTKEELIGKTMMEAYPGIQNANFFPILQDCLKEKIPQHFENEFIYEDGSSGWFDLSMQPVPEGVFILSIDITKRKKAETDLRESEIKFQRIFDESPVGMLIAGLDKRFTKCNKAMWDFLGYKEEELIGKTIAEITYPEDVELGMPELRQIVEGKIEKATIQKRYMHKSGGVVWGEVTISLVRGANNEPLYFLPIIQDINLRKQAEEALAKNRALLAESQEMAKIGGWEFDVVTMAQTWTAETFRILEIDTTQGEPKVPDGVDFIAPEYRDMAKTAIQRAIEHGEPYDQEWEVKTAKGNRRWVRVIAKANRENGKTKSVSGSFQDITDRKQTEIALQINEERYRKAEAMGRVGNWEYDIQTSIFWGSDEAKRIYGFDPNMNDFTTDEVEKCIPERDRVHQALVDLIEKEKEYDLEFEIHPKNSFAPRVITSKAKLHRDMHGKPLKVIGVIQDITERKQSEEKIKASEIRYRRLFESAKDGILILNAVTGVIEDANPFIKELLGYPREEMLGKELWEIGLFKDIVANRENFIELQKKEYLRYDDVSLETKDGRKKEVEFVNNVYLVNGRKVVQCNIRDITDRKQAEEKLKEQLFELQRWQNTMLDREDRVMELKEEVNRLLRELGRKDKYGKDQ